MNTVTLIIAIIGCVTGVCSLFLNFYKFLADKPKLKIDVLEPCINGFLKNKNSSFITEHILILNLSITNIGASPISIKSISVQNADHYMFIRDTYHLSTIKLEDDMDPNTTRCYDLWNQIRFPYLIEPGKMVHTSLIFPFADDLYKDYKERNINEVKVRISSAFKPIYKNIEVYEISAESIDEYYKKKHNDQTHNI